MGIRSLLSRRKLHGLGCHVETVRWGALPDVERLSLPAVPATSSVSLEPWAGEVWDQSSTSSCVAQAITGAELTSLQAQGFAGVKPGSRLWLYYLTRWVLDPALVKQDLGCRASDALRVLAERGLPPEEAWQWDPNRVTKRPPASASWDALDRRGARGTYAVHADSLDARIRALRAALGARKGAVISIPIWAEDQENVGSPVLPWRDGEPRGLHLVQVLDCTEMGALRIQNSWTRLWRHGGRCWLSPSYLQRTTFLGIIDPQEPAK